MTHEYVIINNIGIDALDGLELNEDVKNKVLRTLHKVYFLGKTSGWHEFMFKIRQIEYKNIHGEVDYVKELGLKPLKNKDVNTNKPDKIELDYLAEMDEQQQKIKLKLNT